MHKDRNREIERGGGTEIKQLFIKYVVFTINYHTGNTGIFVDIALAYTLVFIVILICLPIFLQ